MAKKQNVIELNGKHYDALTGAYIGLASSGHKVVHQPVAVENAAVAKADRASKGHAPAHQAAHRPQQTKTLMRHIVKAPHKGTVKNTIKPQAPIHAGHASSRNQRSQDVGMSHMVQRFQKVVPAATKNTSTVTPAPAFTAPTQFSSAAPVSGKKPSANIAKTYVNPSLKPKTVQPTQPVRPDIIAAPQPSPVSKKPAVATVAIPSSAATAPLQTVKVVPPAAPPMTPQPIRPQPLSLKQARRATIPVRQPYLPKTVAAAETNNTAVRPEQDIFEQALARANSHHQKPPKESLLRSLRRRKKNRQVLNIAASAAAFVLLCGFITYQNKANIQLQMASAKAGFSVSDPDYKPEGFAMKKLTYSSGTAASWYANGDKSFSVVQKKSNWDSQSLLENFVATSNQQYQGYEANGRTVYVYGDGKATWVNGGVWYQVQAGNTLSNDQLIKVAASM